MRWSHSFFVQSLGRPLFFSRLSKLSTVYQRRIAQLRGAGRPFAIVFEADGEYRCALVRGGFDLKRISLVALARTWQAQPIG